MAVSTGWSRERIPAVVRCSIAEGCQTYHRSHRTTTSSRRRWDSRFLHKKKYDILPVVVGVDSNLPLKARPGPGYYKVPSLRGVWRRSPFEHNGSVATL